MAEDEADEVPKLPPDARLESLEKRLERLQQAEAAKPAQVHGDPNYRIGQLVLSHLVGAPIGGFVVGFVLDKFFGTKPWLTLVMLFLGFGVGVMNVIRISQTPPGQPPGTDR
ncbi:MAG TPA: AtpZ/AtpI family protein [Sphingomicrobium sp.]|jgi:ATP synthase protein I|nr:AtpZ/AtpI family protein [Sphingomicrobium sp.]